MKLLYVISLLAGIALALLWAAIFGGLKAFVLAAIVIVLIVVIT